MKMNFLIFGSTLVEKESWLTDLALFSLTNESKIIFSKFTSIIAQSISLLNLASKVDILGVRKQNK